MRKLLLTLALLCFASPALAQNTQCSDRPSSDSSNACANTRFVGTAIATTPILPGNLPAGVDANVLNSQTSNYPIANTDCGKTIQAGTGTTGLFTVTLPAVGGFPTTCKVTIFNGDTGREKLLSGFPTTTQTILWPLQVVQVEIINGAWQTTLDPGKWKPTSAVVFNVSTTGADTTGCLGTGTSACATGQYAMITVCKYLDASLLNLNTVPSVTIQYAAGTYPAGISQFCDPQPLPWSSSMQSGWLKIAGNTNLTSVTLNCGATVCFSPVHSLAGWWIEGFSTTGTAGSFNIDAGSHIYFGINKSGTTGAGSYDLACAFGSLCEFETNFTVTGNKGQFISASQSGSRVIYKPITITIATPTTYSTFYTVNTNATISASGATYSGTATVTTGGGCVVATVGGGLDTNGSLAPVTTACGGQTSSIVSPGWAQ